MDIWFNAIKYYVRTRLLIISLNCPELQSIYRYLDIPSKCWYFRPYVADENKSKFIRQCLRPWI